MSLIEKLSPSYCPEKGWGLYPEVRSASGAGVDGLRIADGIAVSLWPSRGLEVHGFEAKASRADYLREVREPAKALEIGRFCSRWYLVVPAPWKRVVLSREELPPHWGMIEVGTGEPSIVVESIERDALEPTPLFLQSLLRASARSTVAETGGVPLQTITRPTLSRHHVGLACGHAAPAPGAKKPPTKIPCFACLDGAPPDLEVARAVIADADTTVLRLLSEEIGARR